MIPFNEDYCVRSRWRNHKGLYSAWSHYGRMWGSHTIDLLSVGRGCRWNDPDDPSMKPYQTVSYTQSTTMASSWSCRLSSRPLNGEVNGPMDWALVPCALWAMKAGSKPVTSIVWKPATPNFLQRHPLEDQIYGTDPVHHVR